MKLAVEAIAASAVVLRQENGETRQLMMKRVEEDGGFWSHVAGGIESDEAAWQTALREIDEEAGLSVLECFSAEYLEQFYDHQGERIMLVPVFVAFVSKDAKVVLNEEHSAFRWCTLAEAKELAPFIGQKKLYEHVWHYFVEQTPPEVSRIGF